MGAVGGLGGVGCGNLASANFWSAFGANAASKKEVVRYKPFALLAAAGWSNTMSPNVMAANSATMLISRIDDGCPVWSVKYPALVWLFMVLPSFCLFGGSMKLDCIPVALDTPLVAVTRCATGEQDLAFIVR